MPSRGQLPPPGARLRAPYLQHQLIHLFFHNLELHLISVATPLAYISICFVRTLHLIRSSPFNLPSLPPTMRAAFGLSLLPLLAAAFPFRDTSIHKDAAPLLSATNAREIQDSYIIVFKKHVDHDSAREHHGWVQDLHFRTEQVLKTDLKKRDLTGDVFAGLKHTYNLAGNLLGYSGHFHEDVIEEIRRHPDVSIPITPSHDQVRPDHMQAWERS